MASESMETIALAPLNALTTHLQSLITSLTTTTTFSTAPTHASALAAADDNLSIALTHLKQHQSNYARILQLRDEAALLEHQIKETVRNAVNLRQEIGEINPSYLDSDTDSENEEERKVHEVDYQLLLDFAARIGKHNSIAAMEAGRERERRKAAQLTRGAVAQDGVAQVGVTNASADAGGGDGEAEGEAQQQQARQDDIRMAEAGLDAEVATKRAKIPYPVDELLRTGELGHLQYLMEQEGVAAVDKEVERMVRSTEIVERGLGEEEERRKMVDEEVRVRAEEVERKTREREEQRRREPMVVVPRRESVIGSSSNAGQPVSKKKVKLNFGADDSDSEDE